MNKPIVLTLLAASSLVGTGTYAWAADEDKDVIGVRRTETAVVGAPFLAARASQLKGMDVKNNENQDLGDVRDLLIDLPEGRVGGVLILSGGVLGVGGKVHPVPPGSLTYLKSQNHLVLNVSKDAFDHAPSWDKDRKDYHTGMADIYRHYEQHPYWEAGKVEVRERDRDIKIEVDKKNDKSRSAKAREDATRLGGSKAAAKSPALRTASEVIGMDVKNASNQDLGDLHDLVVDLKSGRLIYAILASGGVLGVNADLIAVPPRQFRFAADEKALVLNTTKEKLDQAPRITREQLSKLDDPAWASQVYGYYNETVFWGPATDTDRRDNR